MKYLAALLPLLASPAMADVPLSDALAKGLPQAAIAAAEAPAEDRQFAQGTVAFLTGIERLLQARHQHGLPSMPFIFGMRGDVGTPEERTPIEPDTIAQIFTTLRADMAEVITLLDQIPADSDAAVVIDTGTIWFDMNGDGARSEGEGVNDVLRGALLPRRFGDTAEETPPLPVVRFDGSDVAWLRAYAHLLSASAELVLAFDTAAAIGPVLDSNAALGATWNPEVIDQRAFRNDPFEPTVDLIAVLVDTLEQRPNAAGLAHARDHLLAAVQDNRAFWQSLASETDNDREWIPNDAQTSALPMEFPAGLGDRWLDVLSDGEAVLTGDLLVPHWRVGAGHGVDIAAFVDAAPSFDIVHLIQGQGIAPYVKQGPTISAENWQMFSDMVGGRTMLFAMLLN